MSLENVEEIVYTLDLNTQGKWYEQLLFYIQRNKSDICKAHTKTYLNGQYYNKNIPLLINIFVPARSLSLLLSLSLSLSLSRSIFYVCCVLPFAL